MKNLVLSLLMAMVTSFALAQGVTTSAISGQITDENGDSLIRSEISPLTTLGTGDAPAFRGNYGTVNDDGAPNMIELGDFGLASSRWQAQIGLRYIFN